MLRVLFNERNTSPRKIVEIKLNKELNLLDGDYISWTYSLMVELASHKGCTVVQSNLCPLPQNLVRQGYGFKLRVPTLVGSRQTGEPYPVGEPKNN